MWSHNRHLNPLKNPQRITELDKEFVKKLDYSGITFPVTINQIAQIERQNEININLFGYDSERKSVYSIRVSREHYHDHLELLYIEGEVYINKREGNVIKVIPVQKQHYVYIKDFNRLMFSFTKHKERKRFCMHCLQCFYSNISLAKHKKDCILINGNQAIELPKTYIDKNGQERTQVFISIITINNYLFLLSFMLILNLLLKRSVVANLQTENPTLKNTRGTLLVVLVIKLFVIMIKKFSKDVVIYRGEDCIGEFMKSMFEEVENCQKIMRENFNKPLQMTKKHSEKPLIAIFVRENISLLIEKIYLSEITVTLLENIVVLLIKIAN